MPGARSGPRHFKVSLLSASVSPVLNCASSKLATSIKSILSLQSAPRKAVRSLFSASVRPIENRASSAVTTSAIDAAEPLWK